MPLTTRASPRKGAVGTGTSVATSERASSEVSGGAGAGAPGLAGGSPGARTGPSAARGRGGARGRPHRLLDGPDALLALLAQLVHDPQPGEGVAAVEDPALVELAQVALDIGAVQGRPAEQHRVAGQAAGVQLLQVVPHHDGRLD